MPASAARDSGMLLPANLRSWRYDRLKEAGYPQEEAYILAKRFDVDLHAACQLLARGCPVQTAIEILT